MIPTDWSNLLQTAYNWWLNVFSFANGIEIDPSGKYLLICETGRARLHKYYLTGEKAGTSEVFIDSLPGIPDNIK